MKLRSNKLTLMMVGGLVALAFVLSASRAAMSTTFVYRTVSAGSCIHATNESPDIMVVPGWSCGLQAGTENNGTPISGQLTSIYFDYYLFNAMPNVQLCVTKQSFTGASYSDCITPTKPTTFPIYVDTYLTPINVKQNASPYDYVYSYMSVTNDRLHPDYTPVDIRPLGVAFISGY